MQIHFVWPCMHSLIHLPQEVIRIGPLICSSQWTPKCTIGNLGEEIKQHSDPCKNLSQCGVWRAQVNTLTAMILDLPVDGPSEGHLPCGAKNVGGGFVLLCAHDGKPTPLQECKAEALCKLFLTVQWGSKIHVIRWAKLRLPTGQNCNSAWKELNKPIKKHCTAWNVKVCHAHIFLWSLCININVLDMFRWWNTYGRSAFLHTHQPRQGKHVSCAHVPIFQARWISAQYFCKHTLVL